jgi:TP901 family phage tail tape measure protein
MADILLTVGVDTSLSYAEFQAGITSLVSQVNANPPKIKLKFDDSSLSSMKKQIESMTKAAATANTAKSMGGYTKTNSGIWVKDTAAIKANTQAKNENASATKKAADATKQAKASEDTFAAGTKKHTDALNKVNTLLGQVTANTQKWTAARSGKSSDNYSALKGQITALETLKSGLMNGTVSAEQFENSFRSIKSTVTESSAAIRVAGENTQTLGDRFGGLATKFASWLSITQVIMTAVRTAKQMVSAAVEVESAMTQIKIVTGASDSQMEAFLTKSIALAKELGQSVTDVASSIETFARLGYNMSDSSNLAKYANIMANVGNTDVDTATTGITSIIKGYELDANDAEHVSDVLVKVGQEYAISAEELMAAFQRGGAALHASGTDFEKSAALFAATNASLQNAETTGTMWKTVSARIRGATTELEEMGEETDGLAQGLSKYREEIKALSGVDIMNDENTYKDMYDIFVQLAEVWDNMEDVSQSRVAEILGGTRNTSGIMSTITNIKDAIGAYSSAMDSAGTATEANNIYMDTTKAKVGELKAAFQELSSDFISSNFTKGAVEGLKGIVEAIDKIVETVGSLGTILAGLGLAKVIKNVA